ncbi:MAG: hypothetical protein V7605_726 [Acidimicrobiaceae bacterium]
MKDDLRAHLFALLVVGLALVATAGLATAGLATADPAGAGDGHLRSAAAGTVSTLVIDRSTQSPKRPHPRLWVGLVVGVFGVVGLVWSKALVLPRPLSGRRRRPSS